MGESVEKQSRTLGHYGTERLALMRAISEMKWRACAIARDFANALHKRAKTDAIDAQTTTLNGRLRRS